MMSKGQPSSHSVRRWHHSHVGSGQFCLLSQMWSKRSLGFDTTRISKARRLRTNLADLFLGNEISGDRAAGLFSDAREAGSAHVADLATTGASSSNAHRNLLRRLKKNSLWPSIYEAEVAVWNPRTMTATRSIVPMLLPHEILATFLKERARNTQIFDHSGLDGQGLRHLESAVAEIGIDVSETVCLGFWLDGVCTKWDRSQSHDMLCLSMPGLSRERPQNEGAIVLHGQEVCCQRLHMGRHLGHNDLEP